MPHHLHPQLIPESRVRFGEVVLTRTGSPSGDAMARTYLEEDRTRTEPTHELQAWVVDAWEAIAVGEPQTFAGTARRWQNMGHKTRVRARRPRRGSK